MNMILIEEGVPVRDDMGGMAKKSSSASPSSGGSNAEYHAEEDSHSDEEGLFLIPLREQSQEWHGE